ncbi:MAG: hypothetical protein ACE5FU_04690, partial [Nitrospinota bacterium]
FESFRPSQKVRPCQKLQQVGNSKIFFFNSDATYVHPTSIIGPNVKFDVKVKVGPFCTIVGNVRVGANTKIFPNVTIGFPAQDIGTDHPLGNIEIGENCIIREFVTINSSKEKNGLTKVSNRSILQILELRKICRTRISYYLFFPQKEP